MVVALASERCPFLVETVAGQGLELLMDEVIFQLRILQDPGAANATFPDSAIVTAHPEAKCGLKAKSVAFLDHAFKLIPCGVCVDREVSTTTTS